jgi:tetratricopeptide (TPR) repeat protein
MVTRRRGVLRHRNRASIGSGLSGQCHSGRRVSPAHTVSLAILLFALTVLPVFAQDSQPRRMALVIGNANYADQATLANPINDALAMRDKLRELGFDVMFGSDATRQEMLDLLHEFTERLDSSTVVVFYFAGHGVQDESASNFLVPSDALIRMAGDIQSRAFALDRVIDELKYAQVQMAFIILDACRNNMFPTGTRGGSRGLSEITVEDIDAFVAYATAAGDVAEDGEGPNSAFTAAILNHVGTAGITHDQVFNRVKSEVRETTEGRQAPWTHSSFTTDFYFVPVRTEGYTGAPPAVVPRFSEAQIGARLAEDQARLVEETRQRSLAEEQARQEELARLSAEERQKVERINRLLTDGQQAIDDGRYTAAREAFEEVLGIELADQRAEDRGHALALARTARSYFDQDETSASNRQTAIRYANQAIAGDPEVWEPHFTLGQIYWETELYDHAIDAFRAAARLNPEDARIFYELGNSQFRSGLHRDARSSYQTCVGLDPYYENAYYNLGITNLALGETADALEAFRFASQVNEMDHRAYYRIGLIQMDAQSYAAATSSLGRAVGLAPTMPDYNFRLAQSFYHQGNLAQAEGFFAEAARLDSTSPAHHYNLALTRLELGKPNEALAPALAAVALDPEHAEYHYTLGQIQEQLGEIDSALASYVSAIRYDGEYYKALNELGRLLDDLNMYDEALDYLLAAHRLDSSGLEVNNNLGNVYLHKELYDDAVDHFQVAIAQKPNDTAIRYHLSVAYLQRDDFTQAEASLRELVNTDPNYWQAYHRLGEVLIETDRKTEAQTVLTNLLQRNPNYAQRDTVEALLDNL